MICKLCLLCKYGLHWEIHDYCNKVANRKILYKEKKEIEKNLRRFPLTDSPLGGSFLTGYGDNDHVDIGDSYYENGGNSGDGYHGDDLESDSGAGNHYNCVQGF